MLFPIKCVDIKRPVRHMYRYAAKRYRRKPRQALVSSSLDSLGLSAAVAHVFFCKRLLKDS
jgi:hypothetical protein